jgi:hypothetical protein
MDRVGSSKKVLGMKALPPKIIKVSVHNLPETDLLGGLQGNVTK